MKKIVILLLITTLQLYSQTPFTRGVNLTNWFQASGPRQIQFKKYTIQDFENIRSLGCDVVRLPINLHAMTKGAPHYELDELFLLFLDSVVDMAEETGIHLILDNHTFDPAESTSPDIGSVLIPVWKNMAEHFKDRSELIYYEILNEPHGIDDAEWNSIQQQVISAIREVDSVHTIVIGPASWNSYNNLKYMPEYTDDNLLYTFHFYDPFLFTHQGASWTDPSMVPLADVPFPYSAENMPDFPDELRGTWIESSFNDYRNAGTINRVRELIDIAADFKNERNVNIFCGEFGVYIPNSDNNDRIFWYSIVRNYLELKGIAWTIWDYHGGFGIFEEGTAGRFEYDLNVNLVKALGLSAPEQSEYQFKPDSTGFGLYDDYYGPYINQYGSSDSGVLDLYSSDDPFEGQFCIYWTGAPQYSSIGFDFNPDKDLSRLLNENYEFRFKVKGNSRGAKFDIRFLDTKTDDPEDHPWRMRYTITEELADWDNQWHEIKLALNEFTEQGSWDDGWYNPIGAFDWTAVDKFEIVSEHHSMEGIEFWFDDVKIVDPLTSVSLKDNVPSEFGLAQNYPNPFNPTTTIEYQIPVGTGRDLSLRIVRLVIFDILGREVATPVDKQQKPGTYTVLFDGTQLSSGVYFYTIRYGDRMISRKMQLLK